MGKKLVFLNLGAMCRAIKKMKSQSESSLLSYVRSKGEKILEIDGTVTTQPVLEHIGMSTWPGMFCTCAAQRVVIMIIEFGYC